MNHRKTTSDYTFKIAESDSEFDQIFRLNYETFVEEIPQHEKNPSRNLVDKFHDENTYLICKKGGELVGMMALRDRRPFSLDAKLPDLDQYLPPDRRVVEIRLLSVVPTARTGQVLKGLLALLVEHNRKTNWDLAVISGTTRQQRLYSHLGFKSFGPLVGAEGAYYQPMFVELESFEKRTRKIISREAGIHNFLPGPVNIPIRVRDAFARAPISHRSNDFRKDLQTCEEQLCRMTGAKRAVIAMGSGTLANDMVAAQLSQLDQPGLVLANGEFGERLIEHARRSGLSFDVVKLPWGEAFNLADIDFTTHKWLWMAACETSTGMNNNLPEFANYCSEHEIKLCVDCISAVGAYPLDLGKVYLATGSSGKSIAGYPGLALVFHNHEIPTCENIPCYLDIGYYYEKEKVPFTQSSNLVSALSEALKAYRSPVRTYSLIAALSSRLREELLKIGLSILVDEPHSSPAVFTIPLPESIKSQSLAGALLKQGIFVASESGYLVKRNWIQICLMGEVTNENIEELLRHLKRLVV